LLAELLLAEVLPAGFPPDFGAGTRADFRAGPARFSRTELADFDFVFSDVLRGLAMDSQVDCARRS